MLEIRAEHGEVQMNLTLKQRLLRPLTSAGPELKLSKEPFMQQTGVSQEQLGELMRQGLLFPTQKEDQQVFSGDDVLLLRLYQGLEELGLPIALPALIRFQLRQLVRSEMAAFEQYIYPGWREKVRLSEEPFKEFEAMLTLTDTLISVLHRKLLLQV